MMELDPVYSKAFYDVFWGLLIQDQAPKIAIRFLGSGRTPDPKPVKHSQINPQAPQNHGRLKGPLFRVPIFF